MRLAPGIRPRTVLCNSSALAAEILPVPRIMISSGFCSVVSCNSGMGIAFAAIIPPGFLVGQSVPVVFENYRAGTGVGTSPGFLMLDAASNTSTQRYTHLQQSQALN